MFAMATNGVPGDIGASATGAVVVVADAVLVEVDEGSVSWPEVEVLIDPYCAPEEVPGATSVVVVVVRYAGVEVVVIPPLDTNVDVLEHEVE